MTADVITDASGRKITMRKLNVLDQVKLLRAIGPEQSRNQPYVELVFMSASVADIDGVPMMLPANERVIDANILRIGDEGFAALQVSVLKAVREIEAAAEVAADNANGVEAKPDAPLPPSA